jgi:DNA-binding NtrC family response regulator
MAECLSGSPAIVTTRPQTARGHRAHTTTSAQKALERSSASMRSSWDMRMPGMDGPAFYGELVNRFLDAGRSVIFRHGGRHHGDTLEFFKATGRPSLMKPFTFGELRRILEGVLKRGEVLTGRP